MLAHLLLTLAHAEAPPEGVTLDGLVEGAYAHDTRRPADGVIRWRGFDARHATFQLLMGSVGLAARHRFAYTRVVLQVGQTPATYTLAEPGHAAAGGVGPSDAALWRHVQTALAGVHLPLGLGVDVEGGIWLSPVGREGIVARDLWHTNVATLTYALPFYHTGLRATAALPAGMGVTVGVLNGWNSVVDGNRAKSTYAAWTLARERVDAQVLYMGGVEADEDAGIGRPWRSLFDGYAVGRLGPVALTGRVTGGFEVQPAGTRWWAGGLVDVLVTPHTLVEVALRGDVLAEDGPPRPDGGSGNLFFPAGTVGSITATVGARVERYGVLRLSVRHDRASAPQYGTAEEGVLAADRTTVALLFSTWFTTTLRPPRSEG